MSIKNNPWMPSNDAQSKWIEKWNHEQKVCKECEKRSKCNVLERMEINVCQLLRERMILDVN